MGWVLGSVFKLTLVIEAIGFVILAARNLMIDPPVQALWHALFHSVSAFCNAGFSLNDDSLMRYQGDPVVNLTISGLVISGGLGFPVMLDIQRNWQGPWAKRWERLCLHSKIMLLGTCALLVFGTSAFLTLEWDGILQEFSLGKKVLVSFFHSMSCRTAGFNTVDLGSLTNASLFISILLMGVAATVISRLMERFRWLAYIGVALIVWIGIEMIWHDVQRLSPMLFGGGSGHAALLPEQPGAPLPEGLRLAAPPPAAAAALPERLG